VDAGEGGRTDRLSPRQYRTAPAGHLLAAGYALWPTETFVAGIPDPRNEVHDDLVVATGPSPIPAELTAPTPAARRAARDGLRSRFDAAAFAATMCYRLITFYLPPIWGAGVFRRMERNGLL